MNQEILDTLKALLGYAQATALNTEGIAELDRRLDNLNAGVLVKLEEGLGNVQRQQAVTTEVLGNLATQTTLLAEGVLKLEKGVSAMQRAQTSLSDRLADLATQTGRMAESMLKLEAAFSELRLGHANLRGQVTALPWVMAGCTGFLAVGLGALAII